MIPARLLLRAARNRLFLQIHLLAGNEGILLDSRTTGSLWLHHMRRGDFEAAWRISDGILRSRAPVPTSPTRPPPVWSGAPVDARSVLIRCHHGLGDTLQFIRYVPLLSTKARAVFVAPQPELASLLRSVPGIDGIVSEREADGLCEVDVEVMELPYVFRTTLAAIPANVPYVHVERVPRNSERLAVGLVWRAGQWQPGRSIDVRLLEPLAAIPEVEIHILQRDAASDELRTFKVVDSRAAEVLDLARRIRSLDLVIGVDTMVSHLAGALGVPVWLMLRENADWRWMEGREDSPWYPTMRLFRQEREGEWRSVANRIDAELRKWAASARSSQLA